MSNNSSWKTWRPTEAEPCPPLRWLPAIFFNTQRKRLLLVWLRHKVRRAKARRAAMPAEEVERILEVSRYS